MVFWGKLKRFNDDIQSKVLAMQARFSSLGESWQDQEHDKFAQEFQQTLKTLKRFLDISNKHAPYLLRKAQRIEAYLEQR